MGDFSRCVGTSEFDAEKKTVFIRPDPCWRSGVGIEIRRKLVRTALGTLPRCFAQQSYEVHPRRAGGLSGDAIVRLLPARTVPESGQCPANPIQQLSFFQ